VSSIEDQVREIARDEARRAVAAAMAERPAAEEWLSHAEAARCRGVFGSARSRRQRMQSHRDGERLKCGMQC
jgi:hypothetical protein